LLLFGAEAFVFQFAINNLKIQIYRIIMLFCWLLTLREERRLRVFENSVLRRIFGPKGDEVTREWRKLHHEELTKYCSGDKIEKNETGGACGAYGGEQTCIQGFGGESRRKNTTWKTQA